MNAERKEPTYLFTDRQVADKSEIARRFLETRNRLNENVDKADNFLVKRFYNIDHNRISRERFRRRTKSGWGWLSRQAYVATTASTIT